jgi:uncharacterized protein (DUF4415 family)
MAKKRSASSARAARTAPSARRTSRWSKPIDYSDIPASTPEQLASMRRMGRPRLSAAGARQMIAIRLDPTVIERFRKAAKLRGVGYQTLINDVLARHAPKAS